MIDRASPRVALPRAALPAVRPAVSPLDPTPAEAPLLQLVFEGECVEGHDPRAVREAVAAALRLDERRVERLFSGRRVVLRRGMGEAKAHRYIARFAMLGAVVRAEPSQPRHSSTPAATPQAARAVAAAPAPAAVPQVLEQPPRPTPVADVPVDVAAPTRPPDGAPPPASRPAWAQAVRWAGKGALGVVGAVVLGLALGPGLNSLLGTQWQAAGSAGEPSSPMRPQDPGPPLVGQAPFAGPVTPAAVPTADDEPAPDMSSAAMNEYRQRYLRAANHKAFAISSAGGYGWQSGAASENDAREGALESCMRSGQAGDDGCRVVDADGQWLE